MRQVHTDYPDGKVVRGNYIVEGLLGKGGFGAVYRVRERRVQENVFALKEVIDPNGSERERLAFECDLLKRLNHRALPRVYRVFEDSDNSRVYMLMDYIDGLNLEKLRQRQPTKSFSLAQVMRIMAPIVEAIAYLHAQHPPIIHRDIKPANIIVPSTGDGEGAVLVDFGIAKEYDKDSTTTAVRHCSPGYGAPEHYAKGTSIRTDIYGLAATIYTLLTGSVPIDALYRMTQLGEGEGDPLEAADVLEPEVPEHIAQALQRGMAINSSKRYSSVEEFWRALTLYPIDGVIDSPHFEGLFVPAPLGSSELQTPALREDVRITDLRIAASRPARVGRDSLLGFLLIAVSFIALLAGTFWGSGQTLPKSPYIRPIATVAAFHQATVTVDNQEASPGVHRSPVTPYPMLAQHYYGGISDRYATPPLASHMALLHLKQKAGKIQGYFAVGPGLLGNGTFQGTISQDKAIRFLVPGNGLYPPLSFWGRIQKDGEIHGVYCSYQNNRCASQGGGYGAWMVAP